MKDQATSETMLTEAVKNNAVSEAEENQTLKRRPKENKKINYNKNDINKVEEKGKGVPTRESLPVPRKLVLKGVLQLQNNTLGMKIVNTDVLTDRQENMGGQPTVVIRQVPLTFNTSALLPLLPAVFGKNLSGNMN